MSRIGFGTNINALRAQASLAEATSHFLSSAERLSSGLRINKPSDDAAGLHISSLLEASSRVFAQGVRNLNDGISLLSVSESSLEALSSIVARQHELATQAASGNYTASQRSAMSTEAAALTSEYNRIVGTTEFNGIKTLDGTLSSVTFQGGFGGNGGIGVSVNSSLSYGAYDGTTFADYVTISEASGASTLGIADVNGDGVDDIASGAGNGANITVSSGADGSTLFAFNNTAGSGGILFDDFNNDGDQDIVFYSGSGLVHVGLGNGDGTFRASTTGMLIGSGSASYVTTGDYNGDGNIDLVKIETSTTDAMVSLRLGNGDGTFRAQSTQIIATAGTAWDVELVDLNDDGKDEIIALGANTGFVMLGNVAGTIGSASVFSGTATYLAIVGAGDANGDGNTDIFIANTTNVQVWTGAGTGALSLLSTVATTGGNQTASIADMNADGILDIVTSSGTSAYIRFGNGDGTYRANGATFSISPGPSAADLGIGDFNGDGDLDVATVMTANSTARISYQTLGSTLTTNEIHFDISTATHARAAMTRLESQRDRITSELGAVGSAQSRLAFAFESLAQSRDQYSAAASRITDIDMADEVAQLTAYQVVQQSAAAALAHANLDPQLLLKLLG